MTNDKDLFDKEEGKAADEALSKKESKEVAKTEPTTPTVAPKKPLAAWQQALVKAEGKMLAISDQEKTRVELGYASMFLQNSDKLRACDPESIMNAVINVVRTGLTLNPTLKLSYLVPRDGKCVLDPSYMGLTKVLKDNRCVKAIDAYLVFEDEEFDEDITTGVITHKRKHVETEAEHKKRKLMGAYTRSILPDGTIKYGKFIPKWDLDKAKNTSKAASSSYSPWNTWEGQMYEKTAIKRDFKLLVSGNPSEALINTLAVEEENNGLDPKFTRKKQGIADFFTEAEEVQ